jgi:hypothetical protein
MMPGTKETLVPNSPTQKELMRAISGIIGKYAEAYELVIEPEVRDRMTLAIWREVRTRK